MIWVDDSKNPKVENQTPPLLRKLDVNIMGKQVYWIKDMVLEEEKEEEE